MTLISPILPHARQAKNAERAARQAAASVSTAARDVDQLRDNAPGKREALAEIRDAKAALARAVAWLTPGDEEANR